VPVRLLIFLPVFVLLAACGHQVAGTPLAVSGAAMKQQTSSAVPRPTTTTPGKPDLSEFAGTWEGTYVCAQGETGLKLTIEEPSGETAAARFDFFPLSGSSAPSGSYLMTLGYTGGGQLKFTQDKWVEQPPGYSMVDLLVFVHDTDKLSGKVVSVGCQTFVVTRK
jgi:hypothetical protein